MGSKNEPGDFDCYHNALPDEPMFILLARDPSAPELVEDWATERQRQIHSGFRPKSDQAMVDEAVRCAANMRHWRVTNNGVWRNRSPSGNGVGMREALEAARQEIVLAIAFLGRDAGTDRIGKTIAGLTARLSAADQAIIGVLAGVRDMEDPSRNDLIESIQHAIGDISAFIDEYHDFDYPPHQVPAELEAIRRIQHHLEGSLISKTGDYAALAAVEPARGVGSDKCTFPDCRCIESPPAVCAHLPAPVTAGVGEVTIESSQDIAERSDG